MKANRLRSLSLIALIALAALTACGGGGGGDSGASLGTQTTAGDAKTSLAPKDVVPAAACSVGYWGDSIAGLTAPRIDKRLQLSGYAVAGGTATSGQAAFLQNPMAERFVVIEYGINDANFKIPLEPALRSMLDHVRAVGRTPVLTGISQTVIGEFAYYAVHNATIRALAAEYGAIYADWPSVPYAGMASLMADRLHPNDVYQQQLADKLSQVILDAAPECKGD